MQEYKDHQIIEQYVNKFTVSDEIVNDHDLNRAELDGCFAIVVIVPGIVSGHIEPVLGLGSNKEEALEDAYKRARGLIDGRST